MCSWKRGQKEWEWEEWKILIPATDPLFTSDKSIFVIVSSSRMYACKQNVIIEGKPPLQGFFCFANGSSVSSPTHEVIPDIFVKVSNIFW
jgi:hypothetical protein